MLYVFYVDAGSMLKFDINLATQSVLKLQEAIAKHNHIPVGKQVLLVSGGENVTSSNKVSSYFAGTDTNPFFLFNKDALESHFPNFEFPISPSDKILEEQLRDYLDRPPTMEVIAVRSKIVQSFCDVAKKKLETCNDLVHSQHLQHQGWSAVIANLLDITSAFKARVHLFLQNLNEYMEEYERNVALINSFPQILGVLNKIPLLPCLPIIPATNKDNNRVESLLDWINMHDIRGSLDDLVQQCREGLQQYGHSMKEEHMSELKKVEDTIFVDKKEMKIIKGLEDRLSGLERLMVNVKKIVKEQEEMAKMFSNFHLKVRSLQDQSSIIDLCGSHKQYLEITLSNHHCLLQNTYKCYKTKHELCENLNNRLRWVMLTEQSLCKTDNQVLLRFETLKKLRQRLEVVKQISSSPVIFCKAIVEVHRRRNFASDFLKHAAHTSTTFAETHDQELWRRKNFETQTRIQNHFLKSLFPGLDDLPSSYATKCPDDFDKSLPEITTEDILFLQQKVPELAQELKLEVTSESSLVAVCSKHSQTSLLINNEKELSYHKDCFSSARLTQSQELHEDDAVVRATQVEAAAIKVDVSTLTSPLMHRPPAHGKPSAGDEAGKTKRQQFQSTSTSPECEEAHGELFSTADFYFDESLHSSGTTDPASSKKISELQLLLQERVVQLEDKEKELTESKQSLQSCSEKTAHLRRIYGELVKFCSTCLLETRNFLGDIKLEHASFVDVIVEHMHENKSNFGRLAEDVLLMLSTNEETIKRNKIEIDEMERKLRVACGQAEELSRSKEELEEQLRSRNAACEKAIVDADLLRNETEEKLNQMVLENEVEADKMRSDFAVELRARDDEINALSEEVKSVSGELKAAVYDKELCLEAAAQQFEEEKFALKETLNNDLAEKHTERIVLLRAELKEEYEDRVAVLVASYEAEERENWQAVGKELDALMSNLNCLKEKCMFNEYNDSCTSNSLERLPSGNASSLKGLFLEKFRFVSDAIGRLSGGLDISKQDFHALTVKLQETEKLKCNLEKNFSELQLKLIESLDEIKSPTTNESLEESDTSLVKIDYQKDDKATETSQFSEDFLSYVDHQKIIEEKIAHILSEHQQRIQQLEDEHERHSQDLLSKAKETHEEEKKEVREATKSEFEAERQILFNRALNRALQDRDVQIDGLEKTVTRLTNEIKILKIEDVQPCAPGQSKISQSVSDGEICSSSSKAGAPTTRSGPFEQSFIVQSSPPGQEFLDRISVLELAVKNKDQENKKLKEKLMQLSMTKSSQSLYQDNINIRTCNEGSITLFVWDQSCSHYTAYLVSSSCKYFLHSDSLAELNISPDTSSHSQISWIVAEVTSKECCQAKKATNRFKVPVGTKFYRVRAKPWEPESQNKSKKTKGDS